MKNRGRPRTCAGADLQQYALTGPKSGLVYPTEVTTLRSTLATEQDGWLSGAFKASSRPPGCEDARAAHALRLCCWRFSG